MPKKNGKERSPAASSSASTGASSGTSKRAKPASGKPTAKGDGGKPDPKSVVPPADPPRPARAPWPKGGPSKTDLKRYRQALLDLRRNLLASSKSLAAEALKSSGQDFSVDHMADHGSDNYEQDFNLQLLEGESEQLADIRDALLKIDGRLDVPFGLCEACVDDPLKLCETCPWIPPTRLDVLPHARLCVPTKEMQEDGRLRG
jgi:RNA polymerase-binding transcription factor DksA